MAMAKSNTELWNEALKAYCQTNDFHNFKKEFHKTFTNREREFKAVVTEKVKNILKRFEVVNAGDTKELETVNHIWNKVSTSMQDAFVVPIYSDLTDCHFNLCSSEYQQNTHFKLTCSDKSLCSKQDVVYQLSEQKPILSNSEKADTVRPDGVMLYVIFTQPKGAPVANTSLKVPRAIHFPMELTLMNGTEDDRREALFEY